LMARESAADRVNTLRMGLMLVFMDVVVACIICFCAGAGKIDPHYIMPSPCRRAAWGLQKKKCDRNYLSGAA
jgi:hypothetical protein